MERKAGPLTLPCTNGEFVLPEEVFSTLQAASPGGIVYIRQDDEMLTISPTRIAGARRKQLSRQLYARMFRFATSLMVLDMIENFRLQATEWRGRRR
jgi:hypothetical protein